MRWLVVLLLVGSLFAVACSDDDYGRDLGNNDAGASTDAGPADLSPIQDLSVSVSD
jgi:hypothetical protein